MESASASAGNPKEQQTMKQETGRQQPGIPIIQIGEDVKRVSRLRLMLKAAVRILRSGQTSRYLAL